MARNKFIRLLTKLTGSVTAPEMVQRELLFEESSDSLVFKKTNNNLVRISGGGSSITPQPYQDSPTETTLRDALVSSGLMLPQPSYSVSGTISGSGISGVAMSLTGAQNYNTTTDGSGNFTFTGVIDGSYTLTANLGGFVYSPANRSVTVSGANITAQNFTGAAFTASEETTTTHFFVTGSNGMRAVRKSDLFQESATFSPLATRGTRYIIHNGRIFVPSGTDSAIYVFDSTTFAHVRTISAGALGFFGVVQVHASGSKLAAIAQSFVRFFSFDNGTNTETMLGGAISIDNGIADSANDGTDIFLGHAASPQPYNLTRLNWATQTPTTSMLTGGFAGTGITSLTLGASAMLVTTSSIYSRYDKTTLAQIGSNTSLGAGLEGRVAFSGGKFWFASGLNLRYINESDGSLGIATGISPAFITSRGVIADSANVYVADQDSTRIHVINSTTNAQVGAAASISGISQISYLRA